MARKLSAIILMLALAMTMLAIPAAAVETVGEELILNGGIENITSGIRVPDWTLEKYSGDSVLGEHVKVESRPEYVANGNFAFKLDRSALKTDGRVYVYQTIPKEKLVHGKLYEWSADVFVEKAGGANAVYIAAGAYNGTQVSYHRFYNHSTGVYPTNTGYEHISGVFTYDQSYGNLIFAACASGGGGAEGAWSEYGPTMYIDNVSMKETKRSSWIHRLDYDSINPTIGVEVPSGAVKELAKEGTNSAIVLKKTSIPNISFAPLYSKYNQSATDGAPVTLKCRIKMLNNGNIQERNIQIWTGPNNIGTSLYNWVSFNIPEQYDGQWLNLELHYLNVGNEVNQPGFMVKNRADFLVDDVEVYYDTETSISEGKTIGLVGPEHNAANAYGNKAYYYAGYEGYTVTGRLSVPAETVSKTETISPIVRYLPANSETALAVSAIYSTGADGTRRLEKVDVAPLAPVATGTLPARHTEATLSLTASDLTIDNTRTYTVETSILSGQGTLRPLPVQQILPIQ